MSVDCCRVLDPQRSERQPIVCSQAMQIRYHCPTEGCVAIIEYEPLEECGSTMTCPRCSVEHPMTITEKLPREKLVEVCAVCGSREFFVRKDFPRRLGLVIVLVFGIATIYYLPALGPIAWSILFGALMLDLIIYQFLGRVTTCYACRAEYRNCNLNPAHEGFDLATSEKY